MQDLTLVYDYERLLEEEKRGEPLEIGDVGNHFAGLAAEQQREEGCGGNTGVDHVADLSRAFSMSAASTVGWTNSLTLPPSIAISRTMVEDMNVNCSLGVR